MDMDNGYRKTNFCPWCFHHVDAASNPDYPNQTPLPGDYSVCIECTEVSHFDDNMKLIKLDLDTLNPEDLKDITRMKLAILCSRHL